MKPRKTTYSFWLSKRDRHSYDVWSRKPKAVEVTVINPYQYKHYRADICARTTQRVLGHRYKVGTILKVTITVE